MKARVLVSRALLDSLDAKLVVELTRAEALVLFEWLAKHDGALPVRDEAEQQVIWNLEGALDRLLIEPLGPSYEEAVRAAKAAVRDPRADEAPALDAGHVPTKKLEVDVFGEAVNAPVLRPPGRRYPGVLVQGDSLSILCSHTARVLAALDAGRVDDAREEATELHDRLTGYKSVYEGALRAAGVERPYR